MPLYALTNLKQKGLTLVELVLSMVILTFGMLSVYLVIHVVSSQLWSPEKSDQALNVANYYRDQILDLDSWSSCSDVSDDIQDLVEHLCRHDSKPLTKTIPLAKTLGSSYHGWILMIELRPYPSTNLYWVDMRVLQENRLLLSTQFLKGVVWQSE